MRLRSVPVLLVLLTASSVAAAQGQSDDPPPPTAPPAPPVDPATTAAPSTEPPPAAPGPSGGPTVTIGGDTSGQQVVKDEPKAAEAEEKPESTLPFRGSTILFDQSVTTQTAHVETSPQLSYIPSYEWWISFRPRYYFNEHFYVWARFDYYKEFTNSQDTTAYRQDMFGDVWSDFRYTTKLAAIDKNLRLTTGVRAKWPLSLESQGSGIYVTPGVFGSLLQKIKINGESATALNSADFSLSVTYEHPFSRATTPTNPDLNYTRQSTEGRSFLSDQLAGTPLANHTLLAAVHGGLNITPKLVTSLDMIWINQWHYAATNDVSVPVSGGSVYVARSPDDTLFTQNTWFIANVEYDLFDEMSLGLGYYNLASEIAPNGQRRGIAGGDVVWWSPQARIFFDVNVNLDKLYEFASGTKKQENAPAGNTRSAQRVRQFVPF